MKNLLDKIQGGILGFAIGDAFGAPVEFVKNQKNIYDFQPSYKKGLKKGQYTDDTQHLLISLDSILSNYGAINFDDIAKRLIYWYKSGNARSIGRTTEKAIKNLISGEDPFHSGINNFNSCGYLAIPRLLPYCILSALLPHEQKLSFSDEKKILGITHSNKKVAKMGSLVSYYVQELVNEKTIKEITNQIIFENELLNKYYRNKLEKLLIFVNSPKNSREIIEELGNSGFVEDVVYTALYSCLKTNNFYDSIFIATNGFGDSDSRSSLVGILKGLEIGKSNIPQNLKDNLENKDILEKKSFDLYKLSIERSKL